MKQSSFQTPSDEHEDPQIFSIHQDKDGSWHLSRRDFLYLGLVAGGAALVKGICPRFGAESGGVPPAQAGIGASFQAPLRVRPSQDAGILDRLSPNEYVLLQSDHPELGWVEVVTEAGQRGWLPRSFVDFSRTVMRRSSEMDAQVLSALAATPNPEGADANQYVFLPVIVNQSPTNTPTFIPSATPCPSYVNPCPADVPTLTATPCPCNAFPCTCNVAPCVCNAFPCACNVTPCICNIAPCTCNAYPCACNATPCICNAFPCTCNAYPCTCNAYPCACNTYRPCTCNAFPCAIT